MQLEEITQTDTMYSSIQFLRVVTPCKTIVQITAGILTLTQVRYRTIPSPPVVLS